MAFMATFTVYLTGDVEVPASRIRENYGESDHYKMSDRVYMVRADDLAQNVANKLGLDGSTPGATGVVWKLNAAYGGIEKRELWEWLELAQQR